MPRETDDPSVAATRLRTVAELAALPILLLGLVAATAGLALQARRTEAAHRQTAERTLRDYAAFAAWQYVSLARQSVRHFAHSSLHPLHALASARSSPLPSPAATLLTPRHSPACDCALAMTARFAFRIDLGADSGLKAMTAMVVETRDDTIAARHGEPGAIRSRIAAIVRHASPPLFDDRRLQSERLTLDTIGGLQTAIAFAAIPGPDGRPRAIYGVVADGTPVVEALEEIAKTGRLLPQSLVGDIPNDSLLHVRVRNWRGMPVVGSGEKDIATYSASDTIGGSSDGLVASVSVHPEAARKLLIGGLPTARFRVYVGLFALTVVLIGMAFVQVRRWQQLAKLRGLFVANVSHELRTPLTQISMFSEMLLAETDRPRDETRQFVSIINREARRLTNLVESVLRFSHSQNGAKALRPELVLVVEEVREAVRAFAPIAAAAQASIATTYDDELLEATVDPGALRQAVLNLLDNAVKYGPKGQAVRVDVSRDGAELRLAVSDQGPGIPAASREQACRPFVRLNGMSGRRTSGAGIGLSVVRAVAMAHGGAVRIDDAPGGGARVTVTFAESSAPSRRYASVG